jgi:hypothetical protein
MSAHRVLSFLALGLCFAAGASGSPITYNLTVNTSSISGTAGSLDFNFNPGLLVTQVASLQILNFSSNGTLTGNPAVIGHASGALPGMLTFDNTTAFNDYFQTFSFGSTLSFDVSLFGPALSSPDGVSTSGSAFAFSMFSDPAGTEPVLTTDTTNGFAYVVNINLDGTTVVSNFIPAAAMPEPSSMLLLGMGIALMVLRFRRQVVGN